MSTISFGRDKTKVLKGFALLLMLIHHTSTPFYWADEGTAWFSYFSWQVAASKMCVWIFAFLVGYGFFCSGNKTIQYSFKRILMLIVPFWSMMALLFIPMSYITGGVYNVLDNNALNTNEGGVKTS